MRFADLGKVLPQYLQPYLSLLGFPIPPPPGPAAPNIAFNVFCTAGPGGGQEGEGSSSRLEENWAEVKEGGALGDAEVL